MKIAIGNDHRGYKVKERLINEDLKEIINITDQIIDCGSNNDEAVDYPDYAKKVAEKVASNQADIGILICGSGIGMTMVANKVKGIRAALVASVDDAAKAKEHNNANVICFSALLDEWDMKEAIAVFLACEFEGGRHNQRLAKIAAIEN